MPRKKHIIELNISLKGGGQGKSTSSKNSEILNEDPNIRPTSDLGNELDQTQKSGLVLLVQPHKIEIIKHCNLSIIFSGVKSLV